MDNGDSIINIEEGLLCKGITLTFRVDTIRYDFF